MNGGQVNGNLMCCAVKAMSIAHPSLFPPPSEATCPEIVNEIWAQALNFARMKRGGVFKLKERTVPVTVRAPTRIQSAKT